MQKYISLHCYIEKEWSVLYPNAHLAYINNNTVGLGYLEHKEIWDTIDIYDPPLNTSFT